MSRLLILLAALGLIIFIIIAAVLPFKDKLFSLLFPKPPSHAETVIPDTPNPDAPVISGWNTEVVATNDAAYVIGAMDYVGPGTGGGVPLSTSTGLRVNPYTRIVGDVTTAIPDGSSGWYIGGYFSYQDSADSEYVNLAHILPNGSRDPSFNINITTGQVWALALSQDKSTLYVGGEFTEIGGQTRNGLAAVDLASGGVASFNPNVDGTIYSIVLSTSGSTLYIGGSFNAIGGQSRNNLAAVDFATGQATSFNPDADYDIWSLAVSPDGAYLYAGGGFSNIGGLAREGVAKIDTSTGTAVSAFANANPDYRDIYSIALSPEGSTLYVGGLFNNIGGQARSIVAALDTATGSPTSFNTYFTPNGNNFVQSLYLNPSGSTLFVGGAFQTDNPTRDHIAAFDTATGNLLDWNPPASGIIYTFALNSDESVIYLGGQSSITSAVIIGEGVMRRKFIAKYLVSTNAFDPNFNPDLDQSIMTMALSPDGATLYLAGDFTTVNGQPRNKLAAIDTATGNLTAFQVGDISNGAGVDTRSSISSLAVSPDGSTLYLGGKFVSVSDQPRKYLAAVNAETGELTSFNPILDGGDIGNKGLIVSPDRATLYIAGQFTSVNGQPRNKLAALETATGNVTSFNIGEIDNFAGLLALSPDNKTLYLGGNFTTIGGQARSRLASVEASSSAVTAFNPGADGTGAFDSAMPADGSILYITPLTLQGLFNTVGGQSRKSVAAIETATGNVTSWNPNPLGAVSGYNGGVEAVAVSPDGKRVYLVGCFSGHFGTFAEAAAPTPTPSPSPVEETPTPTPTAEPTPTPSPTDSGGGGGSSNPPATTAPVVVPKAPPKTGRSG